jgi:signal transduction histidine kinase/ligand-binding sensor domain-containing protein
MRARYAIIGVAMLLSSSRTSALNPALHVSQYAHTAWRIGEGLLSSEVQAIAQTPDGYLWLGTESGLLRFDGVRAVPWPARQYGALPGTEIIQLLVTRNGRLWIGTNAGLASWKDGQLVAYPELAGQFISRLIEDSKETVWAGTIAIPNARLCAIRTAVQCDGQDGRLGNAVLSLFDDGETLWAGTQSGLWRWSPGLPTRYMMPTPSVNDVLRDSAGTLLVAMQGGVRQLAGHALAAYAIPGVDGSFDARRLLLDRHRALWIGTSNRGLVHLHEGRADLFTAVDGLSGNRVQAVYEDREGSVWVATNEGLDRFRESAVATISTKQGLAADAGFSVLAARDGSVWVGTPDGLTRWQDGRPTSYRTREGLPDPHIATLFEDSSGRILASTRGGIAAFDGRQFVPLPPLFTRVVYNIVEPRPGELWINDQDRGLLHLIGDELVQTIPWSALGRDDHANALVVDQGRNGLWIGFYKGDVAFLQNGAIRKSFRAADGLGAGRVSHMRFDQEGALWAATAGGLSRIKDDRIITLTTANGLPCDAIQWTLADADRSLWILMSCGLARISAPQLAAWTIDPRRAVTITAYDRADGVRTQSGPIGFNPPAARLADGRLWFASPAGIGVVDPGHLPLNLLPPAVHIEQIVADRTAVETPMTANGTVQLPPRVRDLQIDYTATSLVAPERMQFRYLLEGYDREWQDAGTRRQAFYTDLKPGPYSFRVIAANNSGVWNDAGASVQFTIAPAYYQTRWFLALSLGTLVALIWSAYRLRIRVVEKHRHEITALNERLMKAQEQERIRIAGELHDGVMQQMLAMTMMLGTAKRRIAEDSEARPTLDKISDKLVEVGSEIRRMSHDLHPPILQEAGLSQAVRAYCEQFSASSGIAVVCGAGDGLDTLSRGAALALFRIIQEALGNAAKHAHAARISVQLMRSGEVVTLSVSDDGAGFDRSRLSASGGLGLIMMRERAGQLNGTFEFNTAPGRGTAIKVVIPFR